MMMMILMAMAMSIIREEGRHWTHWWKGSSCAGGYSKRKVCRGFLGQKLSHLKTGWCEKAKWGSTGQLGEREQTYLLVDAD